MRRDDKPQMMRIVATSDGLTLDEQAKMQGRGAYLHRDNRCITDFERNKSKQLRSLRRSINREQRLILAELIRAQLASSSVLE
jgi:predicted RNA-binding protein YlxR (DUF448 family)